MTTIDFRNHRKCALSMRLEGVHNVCKYHKWDKTKLGLKFYALLYYSFPLSCDCVFFSSRFHTLTWLWAWDFERHPIDHRCEPFLLANTSTGFRLPTVTDVDSFQWCVFGCWAGRNAWKCMKTTAVCGSHTKHQRFSSRTSTANETKWIEISNKSLLWAWYSGLCI